MVEWQIICKFAASNTRRKDEKAILCNDIVGVVSVHGELYRH